MLAQVFSLTANPVSPVAITEFLHAGGNPVEPHFRGDDLGWTSGELRWPNGELTIRVERYLTVEDDLRDELNNFAADIETHGDDPRVPAMMQHVIQSQQLVTIEIPDDVDPDRADALIRSLSQFLASRSEGIVHIEESGWF